MTAERQKGILYPRKQRFCGACDLGQKILFQFAGRCPAAGFDFLGLESRLAVNLAQEETVVATVHERSRFTDEMELLVLRHDGSDRVAAYTEDGMRMLPFSDIECITVLDGKTYAVTRSGERCRLKLRLYELEAMLPASFIRINKSALANEAHLERFTASFNGAVDAVFRSGYREYVSRRCFAEIKRRYDHV